MIRRYDETRVELAHSCSCRKCLDVVSTQAQASNSANFFPALYATKGRSLLTPSSYVIGFQSSAEYESPSGPGAGSFVISSTAATDDVRTRRLRVGFFLAAWRIESVPEIAGSISVLETVEPDGSFGNGCRGEKLGG